MFTTMISAASPLLAQESGAGGRFIILLAIAVVTGLVIGIWAILKNPFDVSKL